MASDRELVVVDILIVVVDIPLTPGHMLIIVDVCPVAVPAVELLKVLGSFDSGETQSR